MRRILLVLAVAALMAATLGASALPALAVNADNQVRHIERNDECKNGAFVGLNFDKQGPCVAHINVLLK